MGFYFDSCQTESLQTLYFIYVDIDIPAYISVCVPFISRPLPVFHFQMNPSLKERILSVANCALCQCLSIRMPR